MKKLWIVVTSAMIGVIIGWHTYSSAQEAFVALPVIDDINQVDYEELSAKIDDLVTNLNDGNYVKLSLHLLGNSEKAAEEIQKSEFLIRSYLIKELSDMSKESLQENEKELIDGLIDYLNNYINGKVLDGYITQKLIG